MEGRTMGILMGLALLLVVDSVSGFLGSSASLSGALPLTRGFRAPQVLRVRGGKGGATTPPSMQLGGLFSFGKKEEEGGKFERQGNLQGMGQKGFGPLGIVVGGFGDDELEVLAEAVEGVLQPPPGMPPPPQVPIAVLGKEDMDGQVLLSSVLSQLAERDGVLPDEPALLNTPLVMLSGFSPLQVTGVVKAIRTCGIRGGRPGMEVPPMCAIAVPKAMAKTISQLCEEIEGDHMANAPKGPLPGPLSP